MKKLAIGIICFMIMILTCSFSYKLASYYSVDVRTVKEDGHKYVIATVNETSTGHVATSACDIAIIHSEACPCRKNKK